MTVVLYVLTFLLSSLIVTSAQTCATDPIAESTWASNAPPTGSTSVTIIGQGWAVDNATYTYNLATYTAYASVGGSDCEAVKWVSTSSVTCKAALGTAVSGGQPIVSMVLAYVNLVNQTITDGSGNDIGWQYVHDNVQNYKHLHRTDCNYVDMTYDALVLGSEPPTQINAPGTGGKTVTLLGVHATTSIRTVKVSFGRTGSQSSRWQADTSVLCKPAPGSAGKLPSVLTMSPVQSLSKSFSYDVNRVSATQPGNLPTTGSIYVTLYGSNFHEIMITQSFRLVQQAAMFGRTAASDVSWTSTTLMRCKTESGLNNHWNYLAGTVASGIFTESRVFSWDSVALLSARLPGYAAMPDITNGPTTGATLVTLLGADFGIRDSSPKGGLGGLAPTVLNATSGLNGYVYANTNCVQMRWTGETAVTCKIPVGAGISRNVTMSIGSRTSKWLTNQFTYDIAGLVSASNFPVTGSAIGIVVGNNFVNESPSARAGGTGTEKIEWQTAERMLCKVASGSSVFPKLSVSISNRLVTSEFLVSYDQPWLSYLNRRNSPDTGSIMLTLQGKNLGPDRDHTLRVNFGSTAHPLTVWFADSAVKCKTPAGKKTNGQSAVVSMMNRRGGTLSHAYSYDAVFFGRKSSHRHNSPAIGGSQMFMLGGNYGNTDTTMSPRAGHSQCEDKGWVAASSLACKRTPAGVDTYRPVVLSQMDRSFKQTQTQFLTYDRPWLSVLHPQGTSSSLSETRAEQFYHPCTGGNHVTMLGLNFGKYDWSAQITIGGTNALFTKWYSSSQVIARFARGQRARLSVTLTVNRRVAKLAEDSLIQVRLGLTSTQPAQQHRFLSYNNPLIKSMGMTPQTQRTNGPSTGTSIVTFNGVDFGELPFTLTSRLGETGCEFSAWTSDSALSCRQPSGAYGPRSAIVSNGPKQVGSLTGAYTYNHAFLVGGNKYNTPTTGHVQFTLSGTDFGPGPRAHAIEARRAHATAGGSSCLLTTWKSDTTLQCLVPFGAGAKKGVSVTVGFMWQRLLALYNVTESGNVTALFNLTYPLSVGSFSRLFSYDTSFLKNVTSSATTGSASLTLVGDDFAQVNFSPSGRIKGTTCVATRFVADTTIRCKTPASWGIEGSVATSVQTVKSFFSAAFTVNSPVLLRTIPTNSPLTAHVRVTVMGYGFGESALTGQLRLANSACELTTWQSDSSLHCTVAAGTLEYRAATITSGLLSNTLWNAVSFNENELKFNASAAAVGPRLRLTNLPTTGSVTVSFVGHDFSAIEASMRTRVSPTSSTATVWVSDSSALGRVARGYRDKHDVALTLGGYNVSYGILSEAATFDIAFARNLSHGISPDFTSLSTGGSIVTVSGMRFSEWGETLSARIGGSPCEFSLWYSDSTLACRTPRGKSHATAMGVTFFAEGTFDEFTKLLLRTKSFKNTINAVYTFDDHIPNALVRSNGPFTGAASLTMQGYFFGSHDVSPVMRIGQFSCEPPEGVSADGAPTNDPIKVDANGCKRFTCESTLWTSDSMVSCRMPAANQRSHTVISSAARRSAGLTQAFSYASLPNSNGCIAEVACKNRGSCLENGNCFCILGHFGKDCAINAESLLDPVETMVEVSGATVALGSGDKIEVKPRALAERSLIWMAAYDNTLLGVPEHQGGDWAMRSNITEFGPQGLGFLIPVPITLNYDHEGVTDPQETLVIGTWNYETEEWDVLGGDVDQPERTITVEIMHFSKYIVLERITGVKDPFSNGMIIGVVFGVVAFLIGVAACFKFGMRRGDPEPVVQVMADGSSVGFMQYPEKKAQEKKDQGRKTRAEAALDDLDEINFGGGGGGGGVGGRATMGEDGKARTMLDIQKELYNPAAVWDASKGMWRVQ